MRFKLLLILVFLLEANISYMQAQSVSDLKKQYKQTMNELKLKHGLSSIEIKTGDNGFWYYLVSKSLGRNKLYGVIDKNNNLLFECKYDVICYVNG